MRRSISLILLLALVSIVGCGLFSKKQAANYVTPEGWVGATAKKGSFTLDAVLLDDSSYGLEGAVRFSWWKVFNVTVENRSRQPVSLPLSSFSLVDASGTEQKPLSAEEVQAYQSYVMGPLLNYQRSAVRQAIWSEKEIAPGAFAVGYLFFPRKRHATAYSLVLDPNPNKRKDELVLAFPAQYVEPELPAVAAARDTVTADSAEPAGEAESTAPMDSAQAGVQTPPVAPKPAATVDSAPAPPPPAAEDVPAPVADQPAGTADTTAPVAEPESEQPPAPVESPQNGQ
ncbi:MAG TPA: hypothetical protein PK384_01395 [Candidatus Latescibacteria bacterium]|nr:hypothetical protein [Candidatus Latescibacterota bacterium]HQK22129.1 hypothetical protein [Candidatus Latescibacterota bacterium]